MDTTTTTTIPMIRRILLNFITLLFFGFALSISLIEISKFLLICGWIIWLLIEKPHKLLIGWTEKAFFAFCFWMLLSIIFNFSQPVVKRIAVYLSQLLLFVVASMLFRYPEFRNRLKYGAVAVVIAAVYSLLQYLFGWNLTLFGLVKVPVSGKGSRVSGGFIYPNYNAQVLSSLFFYIFIWIQKRKQVLLIIVSILITMAAVVVTGTRSALAGVAVGLLILIISLKKLRKYTIVIAVFALLLVLVFPGQQGKRMRSVFNFNSRAYQLRGVIFHAGLLMAADHPLVGVGPGGFAESYRKTYLKIASVGHVIDEGEKLDLKRHFHSHNNFINVAASMGIPGLLLLLTFLFLLFRKNIRNIRMEIKNSIPFYRNIPLILFAVMVSLLVQGMLDFTLFGAVGGNIFWFAAGAANAEPAEIPL